MPAPTSHLFAVLLLMASIIGCSPHRKPAVPANLANSATVLNNPALRTWDDKFSTPFWDEIMRAGKTEFAIRAAAGETGPLPPAYYLAISGGGANGAYGAGLLCGWTKTGKRPEFKVVTGISTGALTAPFAYCGSAYDEKLKKVYTHVKTKQIAISRWILAPITDDAMMDTSPLHKLLKELVDEQMMKDIAREYARGRILMVATTDLDANKGVIWNIGAIASSGDPKALELIHSILIASAAIPAAFPPVMIDVEAGGKQFQEMHVDGGTKAQVFLYPPTFKFKEIAAKEHIMRDRIAYVIRNARLDSEWQSVERKALPIAARAIDSLIQTQGIGDLYRIYLETQRDGVDFNLAYIPPTFNERPKEDFDPVYMTKLFDNGFNAVTKTGGYLWEKSPPGFTPTSPIVVPSTLPATVPAK